MSGQPHPVIKGRCFEYICRNMQIDVNPHDWFPGFGSFDRNDRPISPLISLWDHEVTERHLKNTYPLLLKRNAAGLHLMWKDFDHSVPDWDAVFTPAVSARNGRRTALLTTEHGRISTDSTS